MTDRDRTSDEQRSGQQAEPEDADESLEGKDVMRGRSFAGANIANTERQQTRDRERVAESGGEPLDEAGEVTDVEIETRETNED